MAYLHQPSDTDSTVTSHPYQVIDLRAEAWGATSLQSALLRGHNLVCETPTACYHAPHPSPNHSERTAAVSNNKQFDIRACRWGATPLQDALLGGHDLVCDLIRSFGGRLELEHAPKALGQAASAGDIRRISLLAENGVPVDLPDYDGRTALHLAATEGQLLSVYILLHRCCM